MNNFEDNPSSAKDFDFFKSFEDFFEHGVSLCKNDTDNDALSDFQEKEILVQEALNCFSFYEYLKKKIREKGFASDSAFYNYIGMSRQTFGKLKKKNASVSRNHALLIAVGLKLDYDEAVEFLSYAGYVFKPSSTREQIIAYVMKTREYDLMLMEEILMIFAQEPLTDI